MEWVTTKTNNVTKWSRKIGPMCFVLVSHFDGYTMYHAVYIKYPPGATPIIHVADGVSRDQAASRVLAKA